MKEEEKLSGLSIAGFVLSFFWIFLIPSILAIIFCGVGLHQINKNKKTGKGFAIAGLGIGIIGLLLWVLFISSSLASIAYLSSW